MMGCFQRIGYLSYISEIVISPLNFIMDKLFGQKRTIFRKE